MNLPPSCFFKVKEMGNKESTWSGLRLGTTKMMSYHLALFNGVNVITHCKCMWVTRTQL